MKTERQKALERIEIFKLLQLAELELRKFSILWDTNISTLKLYHNPEIEGQVTKEKCALIKQQLEEDRKFPPVLEIPE